MFAPEIESFLAVVIAVGHEGSRFGRGAVTRVAIMATAIMAARRQQNQAERKTSVTIINQNFSSTTPLCVLIQRR